MSARNSSYDVVIIGAGHNGLVAACYLAKAGKQVLVLERNDYIGGATTSQRVFPEYDARLSRYAYLVSLFPDKIVQDLGLHGISMRRRKTASYTPYIQNHQSKGLLLSNEDARLTRQNLEALHPEDSSGYQKLQAVNQIVAEKIWDSFLHPLQSKQSWMDRFVTAGEKAAWQWLMERPIGELIESHIHDDILRGVVLTDAKIGAFTHAHDPSLLQNRTYLYHVVGNKTGEWRVPVGGMGSVARALEQCARQNGVTFLTDSTVTQVVPGQKHTIAFTQNSISREVKTSHLLVNAAPEILNTLLGKPTHRTVEDEGTAFKINLLLKRLPRLRQTGVDPSVAFAGTFHINQSYSQMEQSFRQATAGQVPSVIPGEFYCHTLTDPSILSSELAAQGYHTLTLFGIDLPYRLFTSANETIKQQVVAHYLQGINVFLDEPLESCLATDSHGNYCLEAKSAWDLEKEIGLPQGNIFHNALSWFYAENEAETGTWGVETETDRIYLCGSGAKRGGAVSGIPGHNAAMKVLSQR